MIPADSIFGSVTGGLSVRPPKWSDLLQKGANLACSDTLSSLVVPYKNFAQRGAV